MTLNQSTVDTLAAALARYKLAVTPEQAQQLEAYCRLLWDWNSRLNLTRHTDYDRFVARDVWDSHQLARQLAAGETVLDFGSGGGVPGLVIAILRPDVRVSVCESVGKKAKALEAIVRDLGLKVPVHAARVEEVLRTHRYDVVMARAVGSLCDILRWLSGGWPSIGRLLLVKGPRWVEERGEARHRGLMKGLQLRIAATYPMAGTDSESVILKIEAGRGAERGQSEE